LAAQLLLRLMLLVIQLPFSLLVLIGGSLVSAALWLRKA